MSRVDEYPWGALPTVTRRAARHARRIRRSISAVPSADGVARAASEILSADVRVEMGERAARQATRRDASVYLETGDGSTTLDVELEPALATLVLARILGRHAELTAPGTALDDATRGALSAVLLEVARRVFPTAPLRARGESPPIASVDGARIDATVFVDARPYHAAIDAYCAETANAPDGDDPALESLGELPLELPVVAARSVTTREELATLRPGDVWLPGSGWLGPVELDAGSGGESRHVLGRAALSPPDAELGVEVGSDGGRLVLRGSVIALCADVTDTEAERGGGEPVMSDETLTDLVLEAPVVVRVEVASVTLSAREWASLRPGDVLETGLRLAQPAVLRVAGREVGRGELVNVEGELGVRIREITRVESSE